ncbi:MAG: DUF5928 domain-containing protein [Paracoccus sp. (in: a-proteobacteria)]|uniref:DUF5928 domain-containing protein n=1 Tax=Paracoccus sp. TaxID=267 RepID=UPI0026DF5C92|nr:DUF5928 domain-containing protein [Paracoccus sp. (in: a-proteobacteria)]MDO5611749.1 DUF5928 domain-containing protein [Paracoccus sp. (in: a-proteobacteria)]
MARIAFILLCHKDPEGIIAQARRLTETGDFVAIHFDAHAKSDDYARIRAELADNPGVTFARKRVRCGWGEWSLVAATLQAVRAAAADFPQATHFYMLSGDCMPVKSAGFARDLLDREDCDYIESFDFFESDWIKTGIKEERLIYRHWFNERRQKTWFYRSMEWQQRMGWSRPIPDGLRIMIGSQWWCLRRETIEKILTFCDARRDILRFFATTWIPDETFFQTLVPHLVPRDQIRTRTLTFLMFTDYGMPVTFYNDHYDLLLGQDYLFARKISPEALDLKERLGQLWQSARRDFAISGEGRELHGFLTRQGRIGLRFGRRAWEASAQVGRGHVLHVILCKKWHFAKRLTQAIRDRAGIPAVDYLFNESEANLPDLGGLEQGWDKRHHHRRAMIAMLMQHFDAGRLVICLDPANAEVLADLAADRADLRVLHIDCDFSDDYLRGHVARIGLVGADTSAGRIESLIPVMRRDLAHEVETLRDMNLRRFEMIRADADSQANAAALARFLDVSGDLAHDLAETPHLFAD